MPDKLQYNPQELLLRVAAGDEQAFHQLVLRYSEKVFFHAFHFLKTWHAAEETTQDIFLRIWQKREKLSSVEDWDKYLFIVSRNFLINGLQKRAQSFESTDTWHSLAVSSNPADQFENKELGALLEKAIEQLPEQKRMIFRMIHQQGLSQDEVAQSLGIATRTVRWNLVSAVSGIRDFLHRHASGDLFFMLLFVADSVRRKNFLQ
ncbi:RNA polymerase sigma factor [Pseudobacter ginsenosidimutans]|uniref:RNA polymerase sigma-70 factor (ECF subfamily) n=1 Tax=Pseudobacter ginsenosidimutans TaxID=661488 RepID=A0A4Q7MZ61_9BACT|nr:sigma-70 family RNA polymerase sigma factor [Pseudobacter ginsenosidimutans]QEC42825.1 sigma-70 family RNA polymerase sigma factor [Pseudobacter ginsenosidimutans]RZS74172.1 RNA polymerase sigma-70 factor (ECF subfamily) [Pseudobacter ginsenosidimutans]